MLNDKTILITGGTGSFGKKFIEYVLKVYKTKKIIVYSRDELKQYEMQQYWPDNGEIPIRYFLGDVRDLNRLNMAMQNVDIVVHAAALKQVPATEYNPFEAVKTNILGAQNVIDAAMANNVNKVIALSTDKAAAPINLYGATKLTSDKLFVTANNYRGRKDISFSVVRYGNVLGSRGSVIPFFLSLEKDAVFPITDRRMTRFNITLEQGVEFVVSCLNKMWGGEIFVPKIPSYRILDVAEAIEPKFKYKVIGIRPGEKLHEEMITQSDSLNTIEFDTYYVITPSIELWDEKGFMEKSARSSGKRVNDGFSYNSKDNNNFLNVKDLKKLINKL